jgi:hypothetical protein
MLLFPKGEAIMKKLLAGEIKGQIIVLFAVVLVALLGFTALAVDGSMIYSDRRAAQNAADTSALSGGGIAAQYFENHLLRYDNFSCAGADVLAGMNEAVTAAISRAGTNNYTIENNLTHQNGVQVNCHVVDIGPYKDKYIDIKVMVTARSNTSFAQLFNNTPIKNTVTAVVRVHPRTNLGFGYAVAAMGKDPTCNASGIHGNGNVTVHSTHAGVYSNTCFTFTNGKTHVYVNDPGGSGCRYYSGTVDQNWCDVGLAQTPVQLTPYPIPAPDCGALPSFGAASSGTINQGNYTTISTGGNGSITLNPGLYCITGGVSFGANSTVVGNHVTFYFKNNAGYTSGASSKVTLTAPLSNGTYSIAGLLMYAAPGNTGGFTIYGGANSNYTGTIYIPDGTIDAHGGGAAYAINAQLISKQVTMEGSSDLNVVFDGALNYQIPATLDMQQ